MTTACLLATFSLLWTILFAYLADAMPLYVIRDSNQAIGMAPLTLLCMILLLFGISGLRYEYDLLWVTLKSKGSDGLMARVMLPIGLLIPLVLAWLMPLSLEDGTPLRETERVYVLLASMGIFLTIIVIYVGRQLSNYERDIRILQTEQIAILARNQELHDALVTICAWTHKVKDGNNWIPIAEFLRSRFGIQVSHSISPDELERQLATFATNKSSSSDTAIP